MLLALVIALPLILAGCSMSNDIKTPEASLPGVSGAEESREMTPTTNKADAASPAVIQSAIEAEKE